MKNIFNFQETIKKAARQIAALLNTLVRNKVPDDVLVKYLDKIAADLVYLNEVCKKASKKKPLNFPQMSD